MYLDCAYANSSRIFHFDKNNLLIEKHLNYDVIRYHGAELSHDIGAPQLPVRLINILLPQDKYISNIKIIAVKSEELAGKYNVFPSQRPQILSNPKIEYIQPDEYIYSSSKAYPESIVEVVHHGYSFGRHIGSLIIYPLQYIASEKRLIFHSSIEIEISYENNDATPLMPKTSVYSESVRGEALKKVVENPSFWTKCTQENIRNSTILEDEEHLYLIITTQNLIAAFKDFLDWKNKKGLSSKAVSTSWIYSNYNGVDEQEKIRNFIKDAYQNWGTVWILLGGDRFLVPVRQVFAMNLDPPTMPGSDLYYADLDGSWDDNGNLIYGEIEDNIDMYPDVFVGRVTVETESEVVAYCDKVIAYEQYAYEHVLDMLFLAEYLWTEPLTNSSFSKDYIDDNYVPDRFDPINKLYEYYGNENHTTVMEALNYGQNIVNHCGHAGSQRLYIGEGYIDVSDADTLRNTDRYSIVYSIGCWAAPIDHRNFIAERMLINPTGGAVAFVGNSRYGWASPGNPIYGYSDRFDQQFFKALFEDGIHRIGCTLAMSKNVYVPFSAEENVYRFCEYELNLSGDPEMSIWTDVPRILCVDHPDELPLGNSFCMVTVTDSINPIENALVCLMQDTLFYESKITDYNGQAFFEIFTVSPITPIEVTITAHNFSPYMGSITLKPDGPFVYIISYRTNESAQGYVVPGELISMDAIFKNCGNETASNVVASITCDNENIVIIDSIESLGNILPDSFAAVNNAFSFDVDEAVGNGDVIYINSAVTDGIGNQWNNYVSVTGATPIISYCDYKVSDDMNGDGDGFAEPGEIISLTIVSKNSGLKTGQNVSAVLECSNPYITILDSAIVYWDMLPDNSYCGTANIDIDLSCPIPSFPEINVAYDTQDDYQFADSFLIAIGETGLHDDVENGEGCWMHSGDLDLWHITSNRKYSADNSWYCGLESVFVYENDMDNSLESSPIVINENSELIFWGWFEFPTFGEDGLYIEVKEDSVWHILDFIGSGGALGCLTIGNSWMEYAYDLSNYPAGTQLAARFRFVSESDVVSEGVYIDDIIIRKRETEEILSGVDISSTNVPNSPFLFQNYPNPFNSNTTISYSIKDREHVSLKIYNVAGKLVKTLVNEEKVPGIYTIQWNSESNAGDPVASGVYFYRMVTMNFSQTKKLVVLK